MKVVVIIPTYNEKDNIEKLIPLLEEKVFKEVKNSDVEILVADDNSPDGTADVVRGFMKKWKNISLTTGEKEGLGAAYVRAMKYAMDKMKADAVIEFDADFQHDPEVIPRLIEEAEKGADYVIGSRYIKGGSIPKEWAFYRKFISFFGSLFARIVLFTFNIHDMTSGVKLTKTEYLRRVDLDNLYSKDYAYKIQILYEVVKLGAKVKEVPVIFSERENGSSKLTRKDLFESFIVVIRLRIRDSQEFLKFLVVGGLGFVINIVLYETFVRTTDLPLAVSNTMAAQFAIFSNYNLNNYWTFKKKRSTGVASYFIKMIQFFMTSNIGVIFIQSGTIFLGETFIGKEGHILFLPLHTIYFLVGTFFLLIWNFTIYSRFIWKESK